MTKILSIFVFCLALISLIIGVINCNQIKELKQTIKYESMKTDFRRTNKVEIDSVLCREDTVYFYNKGEYLGKSIQHQN